MNLDISNHPCFNKDRRHTTARIHLPIAPACNVQCRFCNRKFDCANESRPGVSSAILAPRQALAYLQESVEKTPNIAVVGIAGPGDPLANPDKTLETLRLIREAYPEMLLCVATNGLHLPEYAQDLIDLKVSHVTVTVNAVDPKIGHKVYAWIRDKKKIYRSVEGAELLLSRQIEGIKILKAAGMVVKINSILLPGINDTHIEDIAKAMKELGVDILNCMPLFPVKGSEWGEMEEPSPKMVADIRDTAELHLPQMRHCTRCRADASGLLGEDSCPTAKIVAEFAKRPLNPEERRPNIAVTSLEGVLVNQHLGEATHVWIFGEVDGRYRHIDTRAVPEPGNGQDRWHSLGEMLHDCQAIMSSRAGKSPKNALAAHGIKVVETEGMIATLLRQFTAGQSLPMPRAEKMACGTGCGGDGLGCS